MKTNSIPFWFRGNVLLKWFLFWGHKLLFFGGYYLGMSKIGPEARRGKGVWSEWRWIFGSIRIQARHSGQVFFGGGREFRYTHTPPENERPKLDENHLHVWKGWLVLKKGKNSLKFKRPHQEAARAGSEASREAPGRDRSVHSMWMYEES